MTSQKQSRVILALSFLAVFALLVIFNTDATPKVLVGHETAQLSNAASPAATIKLDIVNKPTKLAVPFGSNDTLVHLAQQDVLKTILKRDEW